MNDQTEMRTYVGFGARSVAFLLDSLAVLIPISFLAWLVVLTLDPATINLSGNPVDELSALVTQIVPRLTLDVIVLASSW